MSKKLTILFTSVSGVGHVNACIGLAEQLRDRGHKIIFVIDESWDGKLKKYGFIEELTSDSNKSENKSSNESLCSLLDRMGFLSAISPIEKMKKLENANTFNNAIIGIKANEPSIQSIIQKHRPDLFVIDHWIGSPSIIYSGKPWIWLMSGNPLFYLEDERTPPGGSGYATYSDPKEWREFRTIWRRILENASKEYNPWLRDNGFPEIEGNKCIPYSPFINLYAYPQELDYTDIRPLPEKWLRIDTFLRKCDEEFEISQKFLIHKNNDNSSKLIYLSLGSMGSVDVKLMKRLVDILSKSAHKFIVSKGILHDKYELADNMWGERSVPQTKVLPLVDLVITHGGNNTFTETFAFGKPMIIMPLFGDQFDNAQRVIEKGFGVRLDPHNFKDEELLEAIDKLLLDQNLKDRLISISNRIKKSNSLLTVSEMIEKLVLK